MPRKITEPGNRRITKTRRAPDLVAAPWCGVRQHTFEELEASLCEFSAIYESRPDLREYTRQQVIAAKDRAKFLAARDTLSAETRARKAAMAEWMLIWLGDPALFPDWLNALKRPLQRRW